MIALTITGLDAVFAGACLFASGACCGAGTLLVIGACYQAREERFWNERDVEWVEPKEDIKLHAALDD